jgi:hypothetical protein
VGVARDYNEGNELTNTNDDATPSPPRVGSRAIVLPELPMTESAKLAKAIELLESAIADFEKLTPIIGDTAKALAEIYSDELKAIKP